MAIRDYVLKWGSLDEKFLDDLIEEWELDEGELVERSINYINEIESNETLCSDINILIYQALLMIREIIEEKVQDFIDDIHDEFIVEKPYFVYEPNIFINYLDSCIDDRLYLEEIVTKDGVENEEALISYLIEKGYIKEVEYE